MKPLKLTMQAFGSYGEKTVIDFTKPNQNLFLVTGDTGAGKSTIFDAMVFALYGEASSGNNKKKGLELQSQYVGYGTEPFVELLFSECIEGEEQIYKVTRVPQHLRAKLKGGAGEVSVSSKVSLILPDESEYSQNQKETDKKLEEIVGLTKDQFMQVAMIAQGEFMELIRATSDNKKEIFRKLFNTELYQKIVEELGNRRKEMQTDMAKLRTACQQEASHVVVPTEMAELKNQICTTDTMNISHMEAFMDGLRAICNQMEEQHKLTTRVCEYAKKDRDQCRDAYTKAQLLQHSFRAYDEAIKELEECDANREQMQALAKLIQGIGVAYDIQTIYDKYVEAEKTLQETTRRLQEQMEILPELEAAYQDACAKEKTAKDAHDREIERYTAVSERAKKAIEVFDKIQATSTDLQKLKAKVAFAKQDVAQAKECLEQMELQIASWRETGTIDPNQELLQEMQKALDPHVKHVDQTLKHYEEIKISYQEKLQEYEIKNVMFLDAQAGFLAKTLKEGLPCPVCGSMEHPNPASILEDYENLTREMIEELQGQVSVLSGKRDQAAQDAHDAQVYLKESQDTYLREKLTELRKNLELAIAKSHEATTELAKCQARFEELSAQKEYESAKEAREVLHIAEKARDEKVTAYTMAQKALQLAKTKKENAQTLIIEYQANLPGQQEKRDAHKAEYESILNQNDVAEHEWKATVSAYDKSEIQKMQTGLDAHVEKETAAKSAKKTAEEAIKGQERPDVDQLLLRKSEAEAYLDKVQAELDRLREDYRINKSALNALEPMLKERIGIATEYTRLDSLYNRLAGKVSGARMDIETFVQRYYLENVLIAANKRFHTMTSGQFQLRMVGEEMAGAGKNRGLDLMVLSNVTGKEREIRTLSGGESFMAALSLALGMADIIREKSASINLDIMFIDEGFGSLDDHSRNEAVKVLQQMAEGQKLIGIISHVTELKQKIDNQLIVSKDDQGSHVKWQIS